MCGIAGFLSFEQQLNQEHLRTMTQRISHRGPDAEGYFFDGICGLGHRRLSILDLSENANQPMTSHNGRYVMVFNGEIYNYQELREKYADILPQTMRTTSDSEVILELFVQKGASFVHLLNGMFAIAIYDTQKQEIFLFRDRMGVKPLYYSFDGHNLAFASELKALMVLPNINKDLNLTAIEDFLHLGYIPRPLSIYEDIQKMYSGYWIKVSKKGIEENLYWDIQAKLKTECCQDEQEAVETFKKLLQTSVKYRLVSDVPLGVFLSGGIDSSLIASIATEQSDSKISTFSIGFEEEQFNEAPHARKVAKHLQTDHHEFIVSVAEAKKLVPSLIDIYDEPFADSSAVPTLLVSKLARQSVKVVLGGDGGDELFWGYGMYQWAKRLSNPFLHLLHQPISEILKLKKGASYQKASRLFDFPSRRRLPSHIFSQEQFLFSQKEVESIVNFPVTNSSPLLNTPFSLLKGSAMLRQALFDLQYYLQDDLMVKVDRATMHYALEARNPFLDYRLIEFAINLAPKFKYRKNQSKYLLKKLLYQYVPKTFFDRPKQGFSIPLADWLAGDLKYLLDDFLSESVVRKHKIVKYEQVKELKKRFLEGEKYFYNRLWVLINLHQFLEKNH
jgi:asparagine synthase (glutamine-hydrolysing)